MNELFGVIHSFKIHSFKINYMNDLISRIEILIDRDKLDDAQQRIAEGLSQYPDSGGLHALQSKIYTERKQIKKAMESIKTAIGCDPNNDYFYYLKAMIHLENDEYKKCNKNIDKALELDPHYAEYYGAKAQVLLSLDRRDEAIETVKKGLELDAHNAYCQNVLSMALTRAGEAGASQKILENQLEQNPENAFTHANMGYQYLRENNLEKAREHFGASLAIDPTNEFAKSGMLSAIKASNFLYRKLLQYGFWMDKIGEANRWAFIIGFVVVVQVLPFLLPLYLIIVFSTWFIGPLSDLIVYFDKYSRYLFSDLERKLTRLNLALIAVAATSLGLALVTQNLAFVGTAFGCFMAIVPIYLYDGKITKNGKLIAILFASIFVLMGLGTTLYGLAGGNPATPGMVLFLSVIAYSWVGNISK